ncbi:MAG TPA: protein-L-isoaspartate(D-aspartate) O-methyltransferase [Terriglobales bacterium]|nr:protein-L-isoaspartate(D-aspartate) O-methyltransferase [Terriglobales bacterium]
MSAQTQSDRFSAERENMIATQLAARGIRDLRVLSAMARVPRHEFVSERYREQAYEDHPIPIAEGQTVSQPYIVALMLEVLKLEPTAKVLEVGTGSGYMTALLAELAPHVYSIERHARLAREAETTLARLGYRNVTVLTGDGSQGLAEFAPYDGIVVSAAAPHIPAALTEQLREEGRMVIPVGPPDAQELQLVVKHDGRSIVHRLDGCRFVPLVGG